jgi:hypothetical protein
MKVKAKAADVEVFERQLAHACLGYLVDVPEHKQADLEAKMKVRRHAFQRNGGGIRSHTQLCNCSRRAARLCANPRSYPTKHTSSKERILGRIRLLGGGERCGSQRSPSLVHPTIPQ